MVKGVVLYIYLKHSTDYIDSKYIYGFIGLALGFFFCCWNTIFGIFCLTKGKEEVWPSGTQPRLIPDWSCICIPSFRSVSPRVFLAKIPFLTFSCYHGNNFPKFFAHVLSWVKTYHYAEFQRHLPTGLARMMVQTYRQTSPLYIYIYIY